MLAPKRTIIDSMSAKSHRLCWPRQNSYSEFQFPQLYISLTPSAAPTNAAFLCSTNREMSQTILPFSEGLHKANEKFGVLSSKHSQGASASCAVPPVRAWRERACNRYQKRRTTSLFAEHSSFGVEGVRWQGSSYGRAVAEIVA